LGRLKHFTAALLAAVACSSAGGKGAAGGSSGTTASGATPAPCPDEAHCKREYAFDGPTSACGTLNNNGATPTACTCVNEDYFTLQSAQCVMKDTDIWNGWCCPAKSPINSTVSGSGGGGG
jgi:hypothetical protein